MLFSVLMPVYNTSKYLRESIDSLLTQNFTDFELIIVDDGSTDDSGKICDEYAEKYSNITVIHKENGGPFEARKTAIELAKGEYTLFVDSDDFVEKDYFNKLKKEISNYKTDILLFNYSNYSDKSNNVVKGKKIFENNGILNNKTVHLMLLSTYYLNTLYTKAIRTKLLQEDPLYIENKYIASYGEDKLQAFYPLLNAKSIAWISNSLYFYRENSTSLMHRYSLEKIQDRMMKNIFTVMLKYANEYGMTSDDEKMLISAHIYYHMRDTFERYFYNCKTFKEAIPYIKFNWQGELPDGLVDFNEYKKTITPKERFLFYIVRKNSVFCGWLYWLYISLKR